MATKDLENNIDPRLEEEFKRQLAILQFGVAEITPEDEFQKMLRKSIYSGVPLRIKCGIDPTGSDVHLGHLVPYRKMRQFQDLGHVGVVIIGDYTASVGDPTGKNESRPPLSMEQVKHNAETYMQQLFTVLDKDKTEIRYQSEWFNKVGLKEVISWAGQTTVAKLLSHETFKNRLESGASLSLHEMFYPVLQGIDSVYINADVELGGTDQKFNVLMGRDYQKNNSMRPQVAMLLPIVTGTCGTAKMSKSLNNYIGISDLPFDKFGKVMSIPDSLMIEYYKYIAGADESTCRAIEGGLKSGELHPNEVKKQLAEKIVSFFHGEEVGKQMRQQFEDVFKNKGIPQDIPEFKFVSASDILTFLVQASLVPSKAEARRMVEQGGVSFVDGDKVSSLDFEVTSSHVGQVLKVGKRKFVRLV